MPSDPTGQEHLTPVDIESTSATERGGFRKCKRRWFLSVVHRLDPQEGNVNFFLGTLFHRGLEEYYRRVMAGDAHDDAAAAALDAYQDLFDDLFEEARQQLGIAASIGLPRFREAGELGFEMTQNYLVREPSDPLLDEVIAVEFRVNVPITRPGAKRRSGTLSVQADAVGYKDGELAVVDHKTAKTAAPSAHLDIDDQLTAEVFAWWRHSGDFPGRAIYNTAIKRVAHPPKLLKSGKLSKAKNQVTTHELFREAIAEHGLPVADYADILAILKEREDAGEDRLFRREATFRTWEQMARFQHDLYNEWVDMRRVALHPETAYPNPTSLNCGGCPVRAICVTMQDDGDVASVIQAGYVVADPRR